MFVCALQLRRVPAVDVGMLIRRPPAEVFRAFADPAVTTRFWFARSSGTMTQGADIRWDWARPGWSTRVTVKEVQENRRIVFDWNEVDPTTVELRFTPRGRDATYVQVTETGLIGDGDEIVSRVVGSATGFTNVLCAVKALLEHDVVLTAVLDRHPA